MILGVIGGMGPLATCNFFEKIIRLTSADRDQEHIHVIIDNNTNIPDRTDFILGKGEDPRTELIRSAMRLELAGADYIAIPCNTAHYFYEDIIKFTKAKVLNMVEETAIYLKKNHREHKNFLLLATKGTYSSQIYKKTFEKHGLNIIVPDNEDRDTIMEWIYGVKSSVFDVTAKDFETLIDKYNHNKDIPAILGCTELSTLAEIIGLSAEYVDPLLILAQRCVEIYSEY
ncbi:MAG: aspartate/glutamate racemase family protein [Tissierellia bacterium]|nr:aspartate/glutamate racemase family protein [Tissierellia bacterium]